MAALFIINMYMCIHIVYIYMYLYVFAGQAIHVSSAFKPIGFHGEKLYRGLSIIPVKPSKTNPNLVFATFKFSNQQNLKSETELREQNPQNGHLGCPLAARTFLPFSGLGFGPSESVVGGQPLRGEELGGGAGSRGPQLRDHSSCFSGNECGPKIGTQNETLVNGNMD